MADAVSRKNFELRAASRSEEPGMVHGQLLPVEISQIPEDNPVVCFHERYVASRNKINDHRLPRFGDVAHGAQPALMDYCLVLMPMQGARRIDFQTLHRGKKIPGSQVASFKFGEVYTDYLMPHAIADRLEELTTCLCLRTCQFSISRSARRSANDVLVYRGLFPVWMEDHSHHAVMLVIAAANKI